MYNLLFQLSSHVASKDSAALPDSAALAESDAEKFFSEHICICPEDVEEAIPVDGIECEKSECDDQKMQAWDLSMQNETCVCDNDDDDDDNAEDKSLTEEALSVALEGN